MPSAKAPYDKNVFWKYPQFSDSDWQEMTERLQTKLALQHFLQWLPAQREVTKLLKSNTARCKHE